MKLLSHRIKLKPALVTASVGLGLIVSGLLAAGIILAQVTVTDAINVKESIQESVHTSINSAVSDILAVSESVQESVHTVVNVAVTETLTLTESIQESVHTSINSAVSDILAVSESVQESVHTAINVVVTETLTLTESIQESVIISINTQVADTLGLGDSVLASIGTEISSTSSVVDSLQTSVGMTTLQVSAIGDSLITGLAFSRSDSVGLEESVTAFIQRSDDGDDDSPGDELPPSPPREDDDGRDTIPTADIAGDRDGDQIGNEIDGRFVDGRFIDEGSIRSNNFTDQRQGGSTFGSISDSGGLNIALADADSPDLGLQASASGQGKTAVLELCAEGFQVNLTAGDTTLLTCGSLTVTVLAGQVEVDLGQGLVVTVEAGATAKLADLGSGRFAAENPGISGGVVAMDAGNPIEIASGQRVEIGQPSRETPSSTPMPPPRQMPAPVSTPVPSFPEPSVDQAPGVTPESREARVPAQTPEAVVVAPAATSTVPATPTANQALTPTPLPTPLAQPTAVPELKETDLPFPPPIDDGLFDRGMGGVVLVSVAAAAAIVAAITLIGLARRRA